MELYKYEVFLKVVEYGSMSRAAMHCNYSQSAVSQIISSLEKELKVTLLNRTQTGIQLTSEGLKMLPYFEGLKEAGDALYSQSEMLRGIESGHIRIGTFSSISCHLLASALKEFKKEHPNFTIEIKEGDNMAIESWLMQDKVDFGFIDAPSLQGFEEIPIYKDPFVAVVSPDSKYADYDIIPLELFEDAPMVLFDEGTKKEAMGILFKNKIKPKVEFTSRDDRFILSLIENNVCMGFMGQLILERMPYNVISKPTDPQFYRDIILTLRDKESASIATRKFVDFITDYSNQLKTAKK